VKRAHNLSRTLSRILAAFLLLLAGALHAAQPEPHARAILDQLISLKAAVAAAGAPDNARYLTVWDFDGTILDGDCSEGLQRDGEQVYPGLAQVTIEAGLSSLYPAEGGFRQFWSDYDWMEEHVGEWMAYPFIVQMLRGAAIEQLDEVARQTFEQYYAPHIFTSSAWLIRELESAGIETVVLSASPELFVRGAADSLGLDRSRFNGIRVAIEDGRVTEKLLYPVTWADGKRERLQQLIATHPGEPPVIVIGGFGNSYTTDGPFLQWIAKQDLPGGPAVAVMINGGEAPPRYQGLFREVGQRAVTTAD
jgi:phosphoserine phosphatase